MKPDIDRQTKHFVYTGGSDLSRTKNWPNSVN